MDGIDSGVAGDRLVELAECFAFASKKVSRVINATKVFVPLEMSLFRHSKRLLKQGLSRFETDARFRKLA
jgi:hypothetical protein